MFPGPAVGRNVGLGRAERLDLRGVRGGRLRYAGDTKEMCPGTAMNLETLEHPRDGSPMVLIPAGPFLMGMPLADFLAEDHEKPQRQLILSAFWMDVYPVTNARFGLFLE